MTALLPRIKRHPLHHVKVMVETASQSTRFIVHRDNHTFTISKSVGDTTEASRRRLWRVLAGMRQVADFDDASITVRYYPH